MAEPLPPVNAAPSLPELWVSPRVHQLMRGAVVGGALLAGVLIALSSAERPWLAWLGFACGGGALGLVPLLVRARTEAFCGFCGARRAAVACSSRGRTCPSATAASAPASARSTRAPTARPRPTGWWFLAEGAPRNDERRAAALLGAARALARNPKELRAVGDAAAAVGHWAAALEALAAIPAAAREVNDENLRAVAMSHLGRVAEALQLTVSLEPRATTAAARGLFLNNRTWFELLLGEKDLARLLAASEQAIQLVASAAPDVPAAFLEGEPRVLPRHAGLGAARHGPAPRGRRAAARPRERGRRPQHHRDVLAARARRTRRSVSRGRRRAGGSRCSTPRCPAATKR